MNSVISKFVKLQDDLKKNYFYSFDLSNHFNLDELEIIKMHYSKDKEKYSLVMVGECPQCGSDISSNIDGFSETYFHCSHCPSSFYGKEAENQYWMIGIDERD